MRFGQQVFREETNHDDDVLFLVSRNKRLIDLYEF